MEQHVLFPSDRKEWRDWLAENHEKESSVWLGYYKAKAGISTFSYNDAVEEALCFGWIDSKALTIDELRYKQFFTKRKPKSGWSAINKQKIEKLAEQGLITDAGFKAIEIAKANGTWTVLDDVENLVFPDELVTEFSQNAEAFDYFNSLSRSIRKNILQWIIVAKRPETKSNRIKEVVANTKLRTVPKQFKANR